MTDAGGAHGAHGLGANTPMLAAAAPPPGDATPAVVDPAAPSPIGPVSRGYRRYALLVLLAVYTFNFLDRQILAILAEPIKHDLDLKDWQLGLLTGLAFALLYTLLGIPIATWSERGNRPWIIGGAVTIWSGFTALCGAAQNFVQLVAARVGVGIGEAGCTPPAMSLITDYTPKEERASALSIYLLGSPLGALIGMAAGGLVADQWGWRSAFLLAGAPGLLLALLVVTTLKEPRRRWSAEIRQRTTQAPGFAATFAMLRRSRTYWLVVSAVALKAFISYGTTAFLASFFYRNHAGELSAMAAAFGLKTGGFLGLALGLVTGVTSGLGTLAGGYVADLFVKRDARAYVLLPVAGSLTALPFSIVALHSSSVTAALMILAVPSLLNALWLAPSYAAIQGLVPASARATATAILLFVANLIGLGMGPLGVGLISDLAAASVGPAEGVRTSLTIVALLGLPAAALFWHARRSIVAETIS
ncbi:Sugar phosphate permease [Sphingomonas sp. OV641]|uniref:spinster family MFS transporter n=1 Tax=Sphingomonas sp. OV641 TaxID=1881068 RepID=UPI0008BE9969|nr:MFS transporter [Sphingomonas sp. OV641]SEJ66097.1 Sugar phosphate permease [Sphingomonas sp. OV641]